MCRKILVYIEKDASVSTELAMKSQELALALEDAQVVGLAFNEDGVGQRSYFDKIYFVNDDRVKSYSTEYYAKIAVDLIKDIEPEIVLIGATTQGRDLAPQIASELRTGLTADCTGLDINEKGRLAATRPTFGGKTHRWRRLDRRLLQRITLLS